MCSKKVKGRVARKRGFSGENRIAGLSHNKVKNYLLSTIKTILNILIKNTTIIACLFVF